MNNSIVQKWFIMLKKIWLEKDIESVKKLLSEKFEYYENPFVQPLTSWSEVKKAWEEIKNEDILVLEINPLIIKGSEGMASYDFIYKDLEGKKHQSKGAYYVRLDSAGRAIEFRRWWVRQ